jgi:D-lactate dehydrogenase
VLLRFPNVIVTPHNGLQYEATLQRIIATILTHIEALAHGMPQNVVSPR